MGLLVKCYPYGKLSENTYLITDSDTGLKAVIDPGYIGEEIVSDIGDETNLKYILLTHCHFDHFFSTEDYIEKYKDVEFIAFHEEEYLMNQPLSKEIKTYGSLKHKCPKPDRFVTEKDTIMLGSTAISFIATPGHTRGGMSIYADDKLFSGDTLFKLSVGNTSFETGNWEDLVASVRNKIYTLKDDTVVYPGHGDSTTVGYEKKANPFV